MELIAHVWSRNFPKVVRAAGHISVAAAITREDSSSGESLVILHLPSNLFTPAKVCLSERTTNWKLSAIISGTLMIAKKTREMVSSHLWGWQANCTGRLHRLAECQQESLVPVLNSSTGDNFRAPHHEGGRIHMPSPAPALNMQRVT
ncbi:uncharacterized protein LOC133541300 isoform X2 [Nerophis ophidion]|uniref:uncharacterized protein LOC133541300 isoform X2 n=1 Tax=Nerophis ophidion TaxID=159077 RepID=UPI002AE039FE|nr:uncharacterized protein LOC133541300 isoform X2 [Nerophis ophidion]